MVSCASDSTSTELLKTNKRELFFKMKTTASSKIAELTLSTLIVDCRGDILVIFVKLYNNIVYILPPVHVDSALPSRTEDGAGGCQEGSRVQTESRNIQDKKIF